MKKFYNIFIALAFLGLSAGASAQIVDSGSCGANLTWTLTGTGNNLTLTISGTGEMTNYTYHFSNGINSPWYSQRANIKTLVIQNGVTSIGNYAFSDCSVLTGVLTIPNSVTSIGERAFYDCRGLIGALTIPDSVATIGEWAFSSCRSLTSVTIGNSVTSIGYYAFGFCSSLTAINVATDNPNYSSDNGVLFNKNKTILIQYPAVKSGAYTVPNSVITIEGGAFSNCSGLTEIIIPNSVITIGGGAFSNCSSLTTVTIGHSVVTIGGSAFYNCSSLATINFNATNCTSIGFNCWTGVTITNLTTLNIGNNVTNIPDSAFWAFSGLTGDITIPNSVTSIGYNAFQNCRGVTAINVAIDNPNYSSDNGVLFNKNKTTLIKYPEGKTGTYYTIPNSVITIGNYAFYNCRLITSVTIPNYVITIGEWAFSNCIGLTSVIIPNYVTIIKESAFLGCRGLTSVIIPNSVTTIEAMAFRSCYNLTSVTIPDSVTSIGNYAFAECRNLTSVTIGNSVTSIGNFAFFGCRDLESLTIGSSVASIGSYAFQDCSSLTEITVYSVTPPAIGNIYSFKNISNTIPVYIPCGTLNAYQNSAWRNYFTNFQMILTNYTITAQSNDNIAGQAVIIQEPICDNSYQAIIQATANNCYQFVRWNDNNIDNPRSVTITEDTAFIAEFELVSYTIIAQSNNNSFGQAIVTQEPNCDNDYKAVMQATANSGYRFVSWNDGNTDNPRNINVTSDSTFTAIFESVSGIDEILDNSISIYPNPVKEELFITSENKVEKIEICDLAGRVVSGVFNTPLQNGGATINVSSLPQGVYFVKIYTDKGVVTKRVIKN